MMKRYFKRKKNKSGQALVEFILTLGMYFFLIGFMITGFQVMYTKMVMSISAYNGVRYASVYGANINTAKKQAEDTMKLNAFKGNSTSNIKVDITRLTSDFIQCKVSAKVNYLFPIIDPNNPVSSIKDKTLSTQFTMRVERK